MPLKTDTRGKVIDGVKNLQVFGVRSAESKPRWCQKGVTWSPKGAQMDRSGPCFDLRIPLLFLALSFLFFGCLVVGAFVAKVSLTVGGLLKQSLHKKRNIKGIVANQTGN